jgi:hypothetical protein
MNDHKWNSTTDVGRRQLQARVRWRADSCLPRKPRPNHCSRGPRVRVGRPDLRDHQDVGTPRVQLGRKRIKARYLEVGVVGALSAVDWRRDSRTLESHLATQLQREGENSGEVLTPSPFRKPANFEAENVTVIIGRLYDVSSVQRFSPRANESGDLFREPVGFIEIHEMAALLKLDIPRTR